MPFRKKHRIWPVELAHKKFFPTYLFYSRGHFFYLCHALMFLLIIYPYAEIFGEDRRPWVLITANSLVIIAMVYAVSFNWRQLILALALGVPALILTFFKDPEVQQTSNLLTILLYFYVILLIIPYLIHSEKVESDEIFATISLYISLGLAWSYLYQEIEFFYPGSFYSDQVHNIDDKLTWSDFIFFSFSTLTTIGYGDITPITSQGRSLAIIEAITGVVFLGTFVARTVGLSIAHEILNRGKHKPLKQNDK